LPKIWQTRWKGRDRREIVGGKGQSMRTLSHLWHTRTHARTHAPIQKLNHFVTARRVAQGAAKILEGSAHALDMQRGGGVGEQATAGGGQKIQMVILGGWW
jgi:hypothetical protein